MKSCSVVRICLLLASIPPALGVSQAASREQRELRMADQAILASLAVASSPQGRYLCSHNKLACVGPDKGELGLALISAKKSNAAKTALAALVRYRLDAGLYEDYQCYVLENGKGLRDYFIALRPAELREECRQEIAKLIRGAGESSAEIDEGAVCRDQISIQKQVNDLLEAINHGRACSAQDF
jgi:Immunity protein 57